MGAMRKLQLRLIKLLFIVTFGLFLVSCVDLDVSDVARLEFSTPPKTLYVLDEELQYFTLDVYLTGEDEPAYQLSSHDQAEGLSILGFDTTTVGTKTMYISYEGVNLSVVYEVVASIEESFFSGGTGESSNPFLISDAQEFSNIRLFLDAHYKLVEDIDLGGIQWDPIGNIFTARISEHKTQVNVIAAFTGSIDGGIYDGDTLIGRHKIMNLNSTDYGTRNWDAMSGFGLFHAIEGTESNPAVVKNVDITDVDIVIHTPASALSSYGNYVHIENVSVDGSINGRGVAGLFAGLHNSTVDNFVNKVHLTSGSTESNRVGYRFIGGLAMQGSRLVIENSRNEGNFYFPYETAQDIRDDETNGDEMARLISGYFIGQGNNFYITNATNVGTIYGSAINTETTQWVGQRYTSPTEYEPCDGAKTDWIGYNALVHGYVGNTNGSADTDWLTSVSS
jgi:hypothetical protein